MVQSIGANGKAIVLVIEGDEEMRRAIATALWSTEVQVVECKTVKQAFSLLHDGLAPQLIIMNIGLPDAWTLWDHRQETPRLRNVGVIVLSSFSRQGSIGDAMILQTPVDAAALREACNRMLAPLAR